MSVRVVSFGSLNYDLSIWLDRLPGPDETLRAQRMEAFSGGKGANQATAAARLGADAHMVGCVGDDDRGRWLREVLNDSGVDTSLVRIAEAPTGTAVPLITPADVSIVIVPGANASTGVADADAAAEVIADADVLLLQGEVGAAGARRAAQAARSGGTTVVFNPAPVDPFLVEAVVPLADVLVVNRAEQSPGVSYRPGDGSMPDGRHPGQPRRPARRCRGSLLPHRSCGSHRCRRCLLRGVGRCAG